MYKALDDNLDFTVIYLDVAKFFDRIPHDGLLFKCKHYFGVTGKIFDWLASYLTDRKQRVTVGSELSAPKNIAAGCPQGSVLGPLLALMYLNDIDKVTTSPTLLFADDTTIFLAHSQNSPDATSQLQSDLNRIVEFGKTWGIVFNPSKTIQQTFSHRKSQALRLSFQGVPLKTQENHKHLGVNFSSDLHFHTHVNDIIQKINKSVGPLYAVAKYLSRDTLNLIYKMYLRPVFDYCDVVYDSNLTVADAMRLERVQLKIARLVTGAHPRSPTNDLLIDVGWEKLKTRRTIHKLTELYKINNEHISTPQYLTRLMLPTRLQDTGRTLRNADNITTQHCRTTSFRNSFFPNTVSKWNSLSLTTQNQPTLKLFVRAVTKHFTVKKQKRYYSHGTKLGNKLSTRLRLKTSDLNAHLFKIGSVESPQCRCGYKNEGSRHFVLFCPIFAFARDALLQNVINAMPEFSSLSDKSKLDVLLQGNLLLSKTQEISVASSFQSFLIETGRF